MDVRITARHCSITDSVRDIAQTRVSRLSRFEPRITAAEVQFTDENAFKHVEVRLSVPGTAQVQAQGAGDSFRSALDRSVERLERQMRRRHARRGDRRSARTIDTLGAE
ncbi:MAG: ribosome hibernation-promoting factor, HPF/YfiA family [Longimicrobiales bacterium]